MIYAIGDIHRQHTLLCDLLRQIEQTPLREDDRLVFLGDYIDRGPDSKLVLDKLIALRDEYPNTIFLRGNHEQMMLDAFVAAPPTHVEEDKLRISQATTNWQQEGGSETLRSYLKCFDDIDQETHLRWRTFIPAEHWDFLCGTQLEFITDHYHFVHAGLLPAGCTEWQTMNPGRDPRLHIRDEFLSSKKDFGGRVVVFGHTPQIDTKQPLVNPNKLGLDTGAAFGGPLTAAAIDPANPVEGHIHHLFQAWPKLPTTSAAPR